MKRGTKPGLPSIKAERGTLRADRGDFDYIELTAPDDMPKMPDWLTPAGEEVWMEDVGRVSGNRLACERDSTLFGNYCNLQGCIVLAWRALACGSPEASPPPMAALSEVRRMQEHFGIAGAKSRVVKIDKGGPSGNPFAKFKR